VEVRYSSSFDTSFLFLPSNTWKFNSIKMLKLL
jgi:hypothetical protein